jgi:hypothetical protein
MSKERAVRRAARLAAAESARATRERRQARLARRRAALRRFRGAVRPRGRTGRLYARRTRGQRTGIIVVGLAVLVAVWLLVDSLAVRVGLTVLVIVTAPALVVITFDRRI